MNILLTGATGMVGRGVLLEALDHPEVNSVLSIGRRPCGVVHPKLEEVVLEDFEDYTPIVDRLAAIDACLWCLGISSVGILDADYDHITYDYTIAAARALHAQNPEARFCYVSGAGTDSSEQGRIRWARVKGKTENDLKKIGFRSVTLFRPGLIRPMRGIVPNDRLQKILYTLLTPILPLLQKLHMTTSTDALGRAMIAAGMGRVREGVLGNREINEVGGGGRMNRETEMEGRISP